MAPGPSGKLLVHSRGSDLVMMNADGGQRTLLRPDIRNFNSMSSCGDRYLVFDSYEGNKLRLLRTDPDGSNPVRLSDDVSVSDCSADGEWVLYRSGNKMYRLSIEGGAPAEVAGLTAGGTEAISPDGKWIAYTYQEGSPVPAPKMAVIPACDCTGRPIRRAFNTS